MTAQQILDNEYKEFIKMDLVETTNTNDIKRFKETKNVHVYKAIQLVMQDLVKTGIAKSDVNTYDKYKFRGIDAVYNTLSPILARHGLLMLQRVISCNTEQRTTAKGSASYNTTVQVEYDFVSAEDGSSHTIVTYGEGADRGDKSINKALTAAYKYALFQALCIPTEAHDPDYDSPEFVEQKTNEIDELIKQSNTDIDKFLSHFSVSSTSELNEKQMKQAIQTLQTKIRNSRNVK